MERLPADLIAECVLGALTRRDRSAFYCSSKRNRAVLDESVFARKLLAADRIRGLALRRRRRRRLWIARRMEGQRVFVTTHEGGRTYDGVMVAPPIPRVYDGVGIVNHHLYVRSRRTMFYDEILHDPRSVIAYTGFGYPASVDYTLYNPAEFVRWSSIRDLRVDWFPTFRIRP